MDELRARRRIIAAGIRIRFSVRQAQKLLSGFTSENKSEVLFTLSVYRNEMYKCSSVCVYSVTVQCSMYKCSACVCTVWWYDGTVHTRSRCTSNPRFDIHISRVRTLECAYTACVYKRTRSMTVWRSVARVFVARLGFRSSPVFTRIVSV